jgi:beta-phosphoglucomutase-like phosphatase (HAD superfamily)
MHFPALVIFDMAGTTVEDRGQVPAAFSAALAEAGIALSADQITRVRGAS